MVTRRATIAIDFDVNLPGEALVWSQNLQHWLDHHHLRNVEVTVLDDGAPTLPAAPAAGPATSPRSKQ